MFPISYVVDDMIFFAYIEAIADNIPFSEWPRYQEIL